MAVHENEDDFNSNLERKSQTDMNRERQDEIDKVDQFIKEINLYETTYKPYHNACETINNIYSLENTTDSKFSFNILWSNTQTILPILMGNSPLPVVQQRNNENNPKARVAAQIIERCLSYEIEKENWLSTFKKICLDNILFSRGVPWIRYSANEEGKEQKTPLDYVFYQDFSHAPLKSWEEVKLFGWVARKVSMSKEQVATRFGEEIADEIDYPNSSDNPDNRGADDNNYDADKSKRLEPTINVYERWNVTDKKVYWFCKEYKEAFLEVRDDPYKLEGFFPCPTPFYGTISNSSLVPIPDYSQYEPQAKLLETLSGRLENIVRKLWLKGIFPSGQANFETFLEAEENIFKEMKLTGTNDDLRKMIHFMDLSPLIQIAQGLIQQIEQVKQTIFELVGIADIVRGAVNPREKLGQSRLKSQATSNRISIRQKELELCIRDCLRIKAKLIAELYTNDQIIQMSDVYNIPEVRAAQPQDQFKIIVDALNLMRNGKIREYLIEVEENSTKTIDEAAQKEETNEFLSTMGQFIKEALPLAQAQPSITPLITEVMQFAVRGFNAGRSVEYKFHEIGEVLNQEAQQQPMQIEELQQQMEQFVQAGQQAIGQMQEGIQANAEQGKVNAEQIAQILQFIQNSQQPPAV